MLPRTIGSPVAFLPLARPHFGSAAAAGWIARAAAKPAAARAIVTTVNRRMHSSLMSRPETGLAWLPCDTPGVAISTGSIKLPSRWGVKLYLSAHHRPGPYAARLLRALEIATRAETGGPGVASPVSPGARDSPIFIRGRPGHIASIRYGTETSDAVARAA